MNVKRFSSGLVLVWAAAVFLILSLLAGPAPAEAPVRVLKDVERETSADLYSTGLDGFYLYVNERFAYAAWIPEGLSEVVTIPDNADGLILKSKDGRARLRVSGGHAEFIEGGLKGAFDQALKTAGRELISAVFINEGFNAYWTLSWRKSDHLFYRKFAVKDDFWFDCEISFPASEKAKHDESANTVIVQSGPTDG